MTYFRFYSLDETQSTLPGASPLAISWSVRGAHTNNQSWLILCSSLPFLSLVLPFLPLVLPFFSGLLLSSHSISLIPFLKTLPSSGSYPFLPFGTPSLPLVLPNLPLALSFLSLVFSLLPLMFPLAPYFRLFSFP